MAFRVTSIPSFKAVHSGVDTDFDFSESGILGKFNTYFSNIEPTPQDSFMPRDFLYFDQEKGGLVWMYAITEGLDTQGFEVMDFDGGMYVTYFYQDGDDETNAKLYNAALDWIAASQYLELDVRADHYAMGHIITPPELISVSGVSQMESFIPVKLSNK